PVGATPTTTRATEIGVPVPHLPLAADQAAAGPSVWRRPIAGRWVAILLALVIAPPALVSVSLLRRIDRGPFGGASAAELARRVAMVTAQRQAGDAVSAGRPQEALELLKPVWREAPYSAAARDIRTRALALVTTQRDSATREREAHELLEEGKELLRTGHWRDAADRFESALRIVPGDSVTQEYLEVAREHQRMPRVQPVAATPPPQPTAAQVAPPVGQARLELYFNCPVSVGSYEVRLDGQELTAKPFDFRTKTLMFFKRKGSGVIEDAFTVRSGEHKLLVRLQGPEGAMLGEQTLPASFAPDGRYVLKIEMENEQSVPRFYLTTVKGR
ncbi:MAG TPA: hypothetical protein VED41_03350, partial [Solirubrobacteraceae bacterium]|nr:hypothetical protein [Solirubrobacteraceae bacterium]